MSSVVDYPKGLHASLMSGQKKAIAWGKSADAAYKIQKAPYKFAYLIDGAEKNTGFAHKFEGIEVLPASSLESLASDEYIIVIFATLKDHYSAIVSQIKHLGDFEIATPFCPWKQFGKAHMLPQTQALLSGLRPSTARLLPQKNNCIVLWLFKLVRGGAEWQTVLLALGLRKAGYRVLLITCLPDASDTTEWRQRLLDAGIETIRLTPPREGLIIQKVQSQQYIDCLLPLFNANATYWIIETLNVLNAHNADAVIAYMIEGAMIASVAGILANTSHIMFSVRNVAPNEISDDDFCYENLAIAKHAVPDFFGQLIQRPQVVMTSNSVAGQKSFAELMQLAPGKIAVVPNGLDIPDTDLVKPSTGIVVVGMMRLVEQKRPLLFLDVIKILIEEYKDLQVFLIGDGPLREQVAVRIQELGLTSVVQMTGSVQQPIEYLRCADVLLHTALKEGFPNALLEAAAIGCPVVTCDVGGCAEVLTEAQQGSALCPSHSASDLASYVSAALKPEFKAIYQQQKRAVKTRYSVETLANNTLRVLGIEAVGAP